MGLEERPHWALLDAELRWPDLWQESLSAEVVLVGLAARVHDILCQRHAIGGPLLYFSRRATLSASWKVDSCR